MKQRMSAMLIFLLLLVAPLSAQDDMMTAGVEVNDQVSLDGSVTVAAAYSEGPGFIVIHADNGSGGPGTVIGHRQLNSGSNFNISVDIATDQATATLFAMLHSDTGEIGVYEFQQVEGADGPARDSAGNVITPPFNIDLIDAHDQFVANNSVTIATVIAQVDGWLVVHGLNEQGGPGPVAGFASVTAGINSDVMVALDENLVNEVMYPMLHVDTGTVGTYEFGAVEGADGPVNVGGRTAVTPIWTVPHMRVSPQVVVHADGMDMGDMVPSVTADSVLAAELGWLVIHADSGENSAGPVAGFAQVQPGINLDVVVELDPALATPRLFPMLHVDTGEAGVYEFQQVEGADGPVRDSSGNVIVFGIDAAPSIAYEGELTATGIVVEQALIDSTGWLVIHSGADGSPGPVLGQVPLHPGLNRNLRITLDPAQAGELVFPMLHVDTGEAGVYEFQQVEGADSPVQVNGNTVVGPLALTPPEVTEAPEATPADTMASCDISSSGTVNLRQGPGTNFGIAGSLNAGTTIAASGQAQGADGFIWWNLADGTWVRSDVVSTVGDCAALPTTDAPAAPAAPAAAPPPAATEEV